jgi:hypothetical protein
MRLLLPLLLSSAAAAAVPNLSDVDVAAITKTTVDFAHVAPRGISEATTPCVHTAEAGCTLEVSVTLPDSFLTVSKVGGVWIVGRWPREVAEFERCTASVRTKWAKEAAQDLPVDQKTHDAEYHACYPPSGHFGEIP